MSESPREAYRVVKSEVRLQGMECGRCGYRWFPRIAFGCERCGAHGEELKPRELMGSGTIYARTEVPLPDGGEFTLAMIILDDGPAVRGILDPRDRAALSPGDHVVAEAIHGEQPRVIFRAR